jgi:cyclophilin family peptidyl-prolyl cis-trans isomerase/HEAT repeat protein
MARGFAPSEALWGRYQPDRGTVKARPDLYNPAVMSRLLASFALVLALVPLAACPKASTSTTASAKRPGLDDAQVRKLATILRAADRRIVDDELRALTSDPDPRVRLRAALALGQIGDAPAREALEAHAADPDLATRVAVGFSLGLIGSETSRAALETLSADADPAARAVAAEALGRLHAPASVPRVTALLDDPDVGVRRAAAFAAWKFADPAPLVPGLLRALGADDPRVRVGASYALARLASAAVAPASSGATAGRLSPEDVERARKALVEHVADTDVEVRRQIARGLAAPRGSLEQAVVGTLSTDKDPIVRINAVRSLGYSGIPVKPYLDKAMTDKDDAVTRVAIESVGKIGTGAALGLIQQHLDDYVGPWLRGPLMTSLAQCDPSRLPDIVDGLLMQPEPVMRLTAAPLITGHREAGAIRAGYALASDPDPRIQAAGVAFFADQDGPLGKLLGARVNAPDPVVRAAVVEAIGARLETPRSGTEPREALLDMLDVQWTLAEKDELPDVRVAVVDAAAKPPVDARATQMLERGLKDPNVVVRQRAAERLTALTGTDRRPDVGPATDRPLADYEAIVRWGAVPRAAVVTVDREDRLPGRFSIRLDPDAAPLAAWNFAELAGKRFFDGLNVHRVVPGFVVQDGDPRGDGFGGPGYAIRDEFGPVPFEAGTLGMASDGKDTAGSQWFVTLSMQPHLDGRYTAFGRVVQGLRSVVEAIRPGDRVVSVRVYEGDATEPLPTD